VRKSQRVSGFVRGQLVDPGELDPDHIHLPGIFVDRIIEIGPQRKIIEKKTVTAPGATE